MTTNEMILTVYRKNFAAAYAAEFVNDECPNGGPVTDMAVEMTINELGCTREQVEEVDATS